MDIFVKIFSIRIVMMVMLLFLVTGCAQKKLNDPNAMWKPSGLIVVK